jgi:hypothetical protein
MDTKEQLVTALDGVFFLVTNAPTIITLLLVSMLFEHRDEV